jgi:GNAT superfamily N-acetyltransferase
MGKTLKRLQRYGGLYVYRVLVRPLEATPREAAAPEGMCFRVLSEAELLAQCADPELELPEDSARAAFARGDVCVGALEGARLLGYAWVAFGATPESHGVWVDRAAGACYSYRHFVRPECRGRRIAARLLPAADELCAQRGLSRCLTLIYTFNQASIRASERSGSLTVGYAAWITLFGGLLSWRSPGAKRHGLRFFRAQSNFRPFSAAMRRLASMLAATDTRN